MIAWYTGFVFTNKLDLRRLKWLNIKSFKPNPVFKPAGKQIKSIVVTATCIAALSEAYLYELNQVVLVADSFYKKKFYSFHTPHFSVEMRAEYLRETKTILAHKTIGIFSIDFNDTLNIMSV